VAKTLQGLKRTAKKKRVRLPITVELLQDILTTLPAVCRDTYESLLFRSAFSLAFFGFFRVGEITSSGKNDINVHKVLGIGDIQRSQNGLVIMRLRFSKADQTGKGATITLKKQHNPLICPVRALEAFLSARPSLPGPLLCHFNGQPLSRYQFSAILKKALCVLNPQLHNYSSHSFRLGAATTAAKLGWSAEKIKELGRWSSDVYKVYVQSA
jgi:integrase